MVRRSERESIRSEWSKASAESLLPDGGDEKFSALLLSLDPGGKTGALSTRRGVYKLAYCIHGKVLLILGEERYELSSGDSVLIDKAKTSWENRGRGRAEVLLISALFS